MKEDQVKKVWASSEPFEFSHDECRAADLWIKDYALNKFESKLTECPVWAREVLRSWARAHFGSVEVDTLMTKLNCYPEWLDELRKDRTAC